MLFFFVFCVMFCVLLDMNDSMLENTTIRNVISLSIRFYKIESASVLKNASILMNRFEYILDAGIHYLSQQTNSYDYTVLFNKVNILHTNYESELLLWIVCENENQASNIADVINTDVFIFMLDESLRDTQFKNSKVDSMNLELLDILPPSFD